MKAVPVWHPAVPATAYLCRRFELPATYPESKEDSEAWLYCASRGAIEVCVNGHSVARGMGDALTDVPVWIHCDIRQHLKPGDNAIAARVRATTAGEGAVDSMPWFMADGGIRTGTRTLELTTGERWSVRAAPSSERCPNTGRPGCEFHRADSVPWHSALPGEGVWRQSVLVTEGVPEPVLWSPPAMEEGELRPVKVVAFGEVDADADLATVEPGAFTRCKCLNREGLLAPGRRDTVIRAAPPDRAVCIILDFGRPVTGFPRLCLKPGATAAIEMGFSAGVGSIDSWLHYQSAGGAEDWSGLLPRGGRYLTVRVGGSPEDVTIDCISVIERRTKQNPAGAFSANEVLEDSWRVGVLTTRSRYETYRRGDRSWDWLRAYALALDDFYVEGGGLRSSATIAANLAPALESDPTRLLAYLLFLDAHVWYHGDRSQASAAAATALTAIESVQAISQPDGLLNAATEETGSKTTALNALYAGALAAATRLCRLGGDHEAVTRLDYRRQRLEVEMQKHWNDARGLFSDNGGSNGPFSQWTNGLMLYFDLADRRQCKSVAREMRGSDVARPIDLLQAYFVVGGLWQSGAQETALAQVEQHWGRLIPREGVTWAQKSRDDEDEVPGPEYFLGSQVLGVRPAAIGYDVVEIAPQFGGLTWAEGLVSTRRGNVSVSWEAGETVRVLVGRSIAGRSRVRVPRGDRRFPTLTVNGETVWRNEKFHPNSSVREVISEGEAIVLGTEGTGPFEVLVS